MAPTRLTDLSTEILLQIAGTFCLHCQGEQPPQTLGIGTLEQKQIRQGRKNGQQPNQKSWYSVNCHALFSLCLTSRQWQDIAQPLLYHEFMIGFGDSNVSELYSWEGRLLCWMRTVISRRDLAGLVKAIFVHPRLLENLDLEKARIALRDSGVTLGINDLAGVWRRRVTDAPPHGMRGWKTYFAPFLLDFLDGNGNLTESEQRKLAKGFGGNSPLGPVSVGVELLYHVLALLPSLESFSIRNICPGRSCENAQSDPALRALGISRLPLKHFDGDFFPRSVLELSIGLQSLVLHGASYMEHELPEFPNLKALHLTSVRLTAPELRAILDRCTARLHTFVYEACKLPPPISCIANDVDPDYQFLPSEVPGCLEKHRETLMSLHLDLRQCCYIKTWEGYPVITSSTVFESDFEPLNLGRFGSLETLFISLNSVYQDLTHKCHAGYLLECLPPACSSLHLVHNRSFPIAAAENGLIYLAKESRRLPNLRQVFWDAEHKFSDGVVENLFAAQAVEFGYESWPLSTRQAASTTRSETPETGSIMYGYGIEDDFGL